MSSKRPWGHLLSVLIALVIGVPSARGRSDIPQSVEKLTEQLAAAYGWVEHTKILGGSRQETLGPDGSRSVAEATFIRDGWGGDAMGSISVVLHGEPTSTTATQPWADETWIYRWLLRDGRFYAAGGRDGRFPFVLTAVATNQLVQTYLGATTVNGALIGRSSIDGGFTFAELMSGERDVSTMRVVADAYRGTDCVVVESRGNRGLRALWIAPRFGYVIVRYEITKKGADLYEGHPIQENSNYEHGKILKSIEERLDDVELRQQQDRWIPVSGVVTTTANFIDGTSRIDVFRMRNREASVHLAAPTTRFALDVPNGVRVLHADQPPSGVIEEWRDGAIRKAIDPDAATRLSDAVLAATNHRRSLPRNVGVRPWIVRAATLGIGAALFAGTVVITRRLRERPRS